MSHPKFKPDPSTWSPYALTAAWIGHATVLINFYGVTILTDPVLFSRVGADIGIATVGRKRLVAPALKFEELPPIDLVLLSHAHMDHFDLPTLKRFSGATAVITAAATSDLLFETRFHEKTELGWGEETLVSTRNGEVRIEAFQVDHWGARWKNDTYRGYNGYIVERAGKKLIFGGDTASCGLFAAIRSKGPFELALMPIGSYRPGRSSHCTPEEAVEMFQDCGAKVLLPIHHQTFALGPEPCREPIQRLERALDAKQIALREIGETFVTA